MHKIYGWHTEIQICLQFICSPWAYRDYKPRIYNPAKRFTNTKGRRISGLYHNSYIGQVIQCIRPKWRNKNDDTKELGFASQKLITCLTQLGCLLMGILAYLAFQISLFTSCPSSSPFPMGNSQHIMIFPTLKFSACLGKATRDAFI